MISKPSLAKAENYKERNLKKSALEDTLVKELIDTFDGEIESVEILNKIEEE